MVLQLLILSFQSLNLPSQSIHLLVLNFYSYYLFSHNLVHCFHLLLIFEIHFLLLWCFLNEIDFLYISIVFQLTNALFLFILLLDKILFHLFLFSPSTLSIVSRSSTLTLSIASWILLLNPFLVWWSFLLALFMVWFEFKFRAWVFGLPFECLFFNRRVFLLTPWAFNFA